MRVLLSEAAQNEFLPVSGLTMADALDTVLRADGVEVIDLPVGGQLMVYAKKMRREGAGGQPPAEFTVLAGGHGEGGDVNLDYVFKLLPDLTAEVPGVGSTPIRALRNLLERFGCRIGIGPRGGNLILTERIPVWTSDPSQVVRVDPRSADAPVITHVMFRPAVEGGQNYADCAICFAVDVEAYRRYLASATPPRSGEALPAR
jgi:hypothetical protein